MFTENDVYHSRDAICSRARRAGFASDKTTKIVAVLSGDYIVKHCWWKWQLRFAPNSAASRAAFGLQDLAC